MVSTICFHTSMVLSIKDGVSGLEGSVFLDGVKAVLDVDVKELLKRDMKSGRLIDGREVILFTMHRLSIRFERSSCF